MWQITAYSDQGSIVGRHVFQPPYHRLRNSLVLSNKPFHILIEKQCKLKFIEVQDDYGLIVIRIPVLLGENKIHNNAIYVDHVEFVAGNTITFSEFAYSPMISYNMPDNDEDKDKGEDKVE